MHADGHRQNHLHSGLPDPVPEVDQVRWLARRTPLHLAFPAEVLPVRIFPPRLHHRLVTQIVELFQDEQPHHQPHRFGRTPLLAIERAELLLEITPRDFSRQLVDRPPGIELLGQRG